MSFFEIVEKHLHRDVSEAKGGPIADALVVHLGHSRPTSPEHTPASTRPVSLREPTDTPDPSESRDAPDSRASLDTPIPTPSPIRGAFLRSASAPMHRDSSADLHDLSPLPEHHIGPSPLQELHQALHQHSVGGKKRARSHHRGHHGKSSSHISLPSLLHDVLHPNIDIRPVGVVESQRYMDLEDCEPLTQPSRSLD